MTTTMTTETVATPPDHSTSKPKARIPLPLEIVKLICDELARQKEPKVSKATLVRVARVSRGTYPIAMKHVYRNLEIRSHDMDVVFEGLWRERPGPVDCRDGSDNITGKAALGPTNERHCRYDDHYIPHPEEAAPVYPNAASTERKLWLLAQVESIVVHLHRAPDIGLDRLNHMLENKCKYLGPHNETDYRARPPAYCQHDPAAEPPIGPPNFHELCRGGAFPKCKTVRFSALTVAVCATAADDAMNGWIVFLNFLKRECTPSAVSLRFWPPGRLPSGMDPDTPLPRQGGRHVHALLEGWKARADQEPLDVCLHDVDALGERLTYNELAYGFGIWPAGKKVRIFLRPTLATDRAMVEENPTWAMQVKRIADLYNVNPYAWRGDSEMPPQLEIYGVGAGNVLECGCREAFDAAADASRRMISDVYNARGEGMATIRVPHWSEVTDKCGVCQKKPKATADQLVQPQDATMAASNICPETGMPHPWAFEWTGPPTNDDLDMSDHDLLQEYTDSSDYCESSQSEDAFWESD